MTMIVRPATSSDLATIVKFNAALARETEHRELDPAVLRAGVSALRARGRGVFKALFSHVDLLAKSEPGVCGIRLCVERDNERALATYSKIGMADSRYLVMEVDHSGAVQGAGSEADAR